MSGSNNMTSNSGKMVSSNTSKNNSNNTNNNNSSNKSRNIIASHYQIAQKIGEGSFGIIFKGYDLLRSNQPVAIKFESRKSEAPQLKDEFRAYKILNSSINNYYKNFERERNRYLSVQGIPKVYYFAQEGYYNILIIQLLGPSLEDLFEWCGRKFTVSTVARLAIQMIERIQFLHENNLIYRDIKPDNFLIGATTSDNTIYLVDYGMVKQYRDPITHTHIPYRERKSLSGTARYMSINTHLGREQSRRDDLESLGNVFVYFLKGQLPWQGLKAPTNKLKYEKIGEKKQKIPISELCSGLPVQLAEYIRQVRALKFDEDPDYIGYINLFREILEEIHHDFNKREGRYQHTKSNSTNSLNSNASNANSQLASQTSQQQNENDQTANRTVDLDMYEYDWMRLNDGQGWSWGKNKKINLNGYGSGVRHTTTQQTNISQSKSQSQSQSQSQQQPYKHYQLHKYNQQQQQQQQLRSMSQSNGQNHINSFDNSKARAVSASAINERSGLLAGVHESDYIQSGDGNRAYHDSTNEDRSWLHWLCCCFW